MNSLSKIILYHVNLENIWVSCCIYETIIALYKCLVFFNPIKESSLQINFGNIMWR